RPVLDPLALELRAMLEHARSYGVRPRLPRQDSRHRRVDLERGVGPVLPDQPQRLVVLVPERQILPIGIPDVPDEIRIAVVPNLAPLYRFDVPLKRIRHLAAPVRPPLNHAIVAVPADPRRHPPLPERRVGVEPPHVVL